MEKFNNTLPIENKSEIKIKKISEILALKSSEQSEAMNERNEIILRMLNADKASVEKDLNAKKRVADTEKFLATIDTEMELSPQDTSFAHFLLDSLKEKDGGEKAFEILRKKLENKIIIDLGYGDSIRSFLAIKDMPIKGYIGVDKYHGDLLTLTLASWENDENKPVSLINDDMLHFISKLPDNSVNYIMNGIDVHIILNQEYWKRLNEELARTTESGGIITGVASSLGNLKGFKDIAPTEFNDTQFFILEKQGLAKQ